MKDTYNTLSGTIELPAQTSFVHAQFGYALYENVLIQNRPESPGVIVMNVPPKSLSTVWELTNDGYSEKIELLEGNGTLMLKRFNQDAWKAIPLTLDNPTADNLIIEYGDQFCLVTGDNAEAVLMSIPSKPFDISFERDITFSPTDSLAKLLVKLATSE